MLSLGTALICTEGLRLAQVQVMTPFSFISLGTALICTEGLRPVELLGGVGRAAIAARNRPDLY